jgi:hypothetical protein
MRVGGSMSDGRRMSSSGNIVSSGRKKVSTAPAGCEISELLGSYDDNSVSNVSWLVKKRSISFDSRYDPSPASSQRDGVISSVYGIANERVMQVSMRKGKRLVECILKILFHASASNGRFTGVVSGSDGLFMLHHFIVSVTQVRCTLLTCIRQMSEVEGIEMLCFT